MIDLRQFLTFTSFMYIVGILTMVTFGISIFRDINKAKKKMLLKDRYNPLFQIIFISLLWYSISLINFITSNTLISLWGTRLAFALVPWAFIPMFRLLCKLGKLEVQYKQKLIKLKTIIYALVIFASSLSLFDFWFIQASKVHSCVGCRDVPVFGLHAIMYLFSIISLLILILYAYIFVYKNTKRTIIKARLKIVSLSTLITAVIVITLNLVLPILFGVISLVDYGVLSSIFIIVGFYLALQNKWVYSVKYLISKHLFIWISGILLFVMVKLFEFLMVHVFNWDITTPFDINAMLFGSLLGISVAYITLRLVKYSETVGLLLVYPQFYRFKNKFNKILVNAVYNRVPQKATLYQLLDLIAKFLHVKTVCIVDVDKVLVEPYKICNQKRNIDVKLITNYVRIPLLKSRYLVIEAKNKFISKEFVELILSKAITINALINLDITDTTLKNINSKLAKAVVVKTNRLKSELDKIKKQLNSTTQEFTECKQMFPSIIGGVMFNTKMALEYTDELNRKIPDDYELRFALNRLQSQLFNIKAVLHKIVIFSDVIIRNKVYKHPFDLTTYFQDILDVWQQQFDNKTLGLVRDLEVTQVLVRADFDKINFIINSVIGYMLAILKHGYLHVILRSGVTHATVKLVAVGKPDDIGFSPITDKKKILAIESVLKLAERVIKLHQGELKYSFKNGILYFFEFTLLK